MCIADFYNYGYYIIFLKNARKMHLFRKYAVPERKKAGGRKLPQRVSLFTSIWSVNCKTRCIPFGRHVCVVASRKIAAARSHLGLRRDWFRPVSPCLSFTKAAFCFQNLRFVYKCCVFKVQTCASAYKLASRTAIQPDGAHFLSLMHLQTSYRKL